MTASNRASPVLSAAGASRRLRGRTLKVIGLGGIGAPVAQALVQYLFRLPAAPALWLIDGDVFEEGNRGRVIFYAEPGQNKAKVKAQELSLWCGGSVTILPVPMYVTPRNGSRLIASGDIVFLCVDNHATRKLVANRCRRLPSVTLFSGGNDGIENGLSGTYGNVQVYERVRGRDRFNPITRFHPEIARPADHRPDELGCAAQLHSVPQLLFTNLAVAAAMLGAFHNWLCRNLSYEEVCLDIALARMNPVTRAVAC